MSKCIGCDYCDYGEVLYFFKNEKRQTVRTDFLYCSYCYPDSSRVMYKMTGEEIVSQREYFECIEMGWKGSVI